VTGIETKIRTFFENKKEIAAVYLFGSHASAEQRPESDVDIGILLRREFIGSGEALQEECIVGLGRVLKKDIHPVILNHAGEVLMKQIFSKGKPVLVRDQEFDKNFRMVSLSNIADFNFHLQQMQAGLTKKILRK
jgi:predicted nucleotidyltransferase